FTFLNMLAIFMGMQVPVSYFIVGGAITAGLTLAQTLSVTLGAFIVGFLIFSLIGKIGQQAGVTTMVASRPAFGIIGSILPAVITFIELAGWDSVHIQLAGILLNTTSHDVFGGGSQAVFSIIVGVIILLLVVFGSKVLKVMEQFLVPAVLLLVAMALYVALGDHSFGSLLHRAGKGNLTPAIGFDAMLISALTWVPMVADYTRFGKTSRSAFWAALIGSVPVALFMNGIGQISAVSLGDSNPIVPMVHHGRVFGVVAFIVVIFATIATAALILYSATISAVSVFPKVRVKTMAIIIGVICIALSVGVNLLGNVINWLNFQGYLLIPLFSVILVDYFLVSRSHYEPAELFDKAGRYMYFKGFNVIGYVAWILGALTFFLAQHSAIGGSILGMLVSGVVYFILSKVSQARVSVAPVMGQKPDR
ncbi:MAG: cytosine permease, partial [Alicyclobacillus sp.]|nr:cytosine permease [Alicyclobacillus sp.]